MKKLSGKLTGCDDKTWTAIASDCSLVDEQDTGAAGRSPTSTLATTGRLKLVLRARNVGVLSALADCRRCRCCSCCCCCGQQQLRERMTPVQPIVTNTKKSHVIRKENWHREKKCDVGKLGARWRRRSGRRLQQDWPGHTARLSSAHGWKPVDMSNNNNNF